MLPKMVTQVELFLIVMSGRIAFIPLISGVDNGDFTYERRSVFGFIEKKWSYDIASKEEK